MKNLSSLWTFAGSLGTLAAILTIMPWTSQAAASTVIINEIAWMGNKTSQNDEWIELFNNSDSITDLSGWVLKTEDEGIKTVLAGKIQAKGFYLLERTDDNTVPTVTANQIYKGTLSNNGENIGLYDVSGNLIDSINASGGWPAGNNISKQTMERISSLADNAAGKWQSSQNPGGTPGMTNSLIVQLPLQEQINATTSENTTSIQTHQQKNKARGSFPSGIVINELLPSPKGPDDQNEWIEIFNQNDFTVDLSDWQIKDKIGTVKTYIFPEGTHIAAQSFLVFGRPETKITLNNEKDGLELIRPDGTITDEVEYRKAPQNQSYNRTDTGWQWSAILTAGSANIVSLPESEKTNANIGNDGTETENNLLAAINQNTSQFPKTPIPLSLFSLNFAIALALATASGAAVLMLKRKLTPKK